MPSKNTLTEMFGVGVGLLWPLIVTSVDALVDQARPLWGRFLEAHVVGHRLARPRLQGIRPD